MRSKHSFKRVLLMLSSLRQCFTGNSPRSRNFTRWKLLFLVILISTMYIYLSSSHRTDRWCDPAEPLWWFCPWPDPSTTVCSWRDHFPVNRSDEFSSVARVQRSFEFNNSTVRRCLEPTLDFLIFIISKSSHFSTRQTIRRTWAEKTVYAKVFPHLRVKFLFLLDLDLHSRENIELENSLHQDLVQVINLPEHYEYVTLREAAMYTFVRQRCPQTKYLLKTDDDIFLNLFLLFSSSDRFLSNISSTLFGYPIDFGLVVRHGMDSVGERYVITHEEYACPRYPRFLSGFAYLLSFPLVTILLDAFEKDPRPFPLSDVYFTGLLPELFELPRRSLFDHLHYLYQSSCHEQFFRSQSADHQPFACAATTEHFHRSKDEHDSSRPTGMNSYHRLWMTLKELHT